MGNIELVQGSWSLGACPSMQSIFKHVSRQNNGLQLDVRTHERAALTCFMPFVAVLPRSAQSQRLLHCRVGLLSGHRMMPQEGSRGGPAACQARQANGASTLLTQHRACQVAARPIQGLWTACMGLHRPAPLGPSHPAPGHRAMLRNHGRSEQGCRPQLNEQGFDSWFKEPTSAFLITAQARQA